MRCRLVMFWLCAFGTVGCVASEGDGRLASPDEAAFATHAYEVLLRDCGFVECHGGEGRFFRIVGPGRSRLSLDAPLFSPLPEEISLSYRSVRAVIDPQRPAESELLRKPLSPQAGGIGHKGTDAYGRDVYSTVLDPNYMILQDFVRTAAAVQSRPGGQP